MRLAQGNQKLTASGNPKKSDGITPDLRRRGMP